MAPWVKCGTHHACCHCQTHGSCRAHLAMPAAIARHMGVGNAHRGVGPGTHQNNNKNIKLNEDEVLVDVVLELAIV